MHLFKTRDHRIVKWAYPDDYIPLKCEACGAIFVTLNDGPITRHPIHYGTDEEKCVACEGKEHSILLLKPDKKTFIAGNF